MTVLVAVAVLLATAVDFSPLKPQKTLSMLSAAAAAPVEPSRLAYYTEFRAPLLRDLTSVDTNTVGSWSFSRGLPKGWNVANVAKVQQQGQPWTTVDTSVKNFERQLRSPPLVLGPGKYEAIVVGRVIRGGLAFGVERATVCLGNSFFSAGQWREPRDRGMARPFDVSVRGAYRIDLSNWSYPDDASAWAITRILVRRLSFAELPAVRAAFAGPATPLTLRRAAVARTVTLHVWHFTTGLPPFWAAEANTKITRTNRGAVVETAAKNYNYAVTSRPLMLDKGSYSVVLDGSIPTGGLEIGVTTLSTGKETFVGNKVFWYGQGFAGRVAVATFSLEVPGTVRIILANWNPFDRRSVWDVRRVSLLARIS